MKKTKITLCLFLSVTQLSTAQNLIQDGGFENISGSSWSFDLGSEWSGYSRALAWDDQPTGLDGPWLEIEGLTDITAAREGDYAAYIWSNVDTFQFVATTVGDTYTFGGLLGNPEKASTTNSGASGGAIVGAFIDGVAVYQREEGEWGAFSHTFVATSASTEIALGFVQNDAGGTEFVVADNFSLVKNVPEPSSALLSALGIFGLLMQRRRS